MYVLTQFVNLVKNKVDQALDIMGKYMKTDLCLDVYSLFKITGIVQVPRERDF